MHSEQLLADWRDKAIRFESEIEKAIIGQPRAIRLMTIAVFSRGHVLLEGNVGVGKTTLLRRCRSPSEGNTNGSKGPSI